MKQKEESLVTLIVAPIDIPNFPYTPAELIFLDIECESSNAP